MLKKLSPHFYVGFILQNKNANNRLIPDYALVRRQSTIKQHASLLHCPLHLPKQGVFPSHS
jgi:hypothetical protein